MEDLEKEEDFSTYTPRPQLMTCQGDKPLLKTQSEDLSYLKYPNKDEYFSFQPQYKVDKKVTQDLSINRLFYQKIDPKKANNFAKGKEYNHHIHH